MHKKITQAIIAGFVIFLCFGAVHHVCGRYIGHNNIPIPIRYPFDQFVSGNDQFSLHKNYVEIHNTHSNETTQLNVQNITTKNDNKVITIHLPHGVKVVITHKLPFHTHMKSYGYYGDPDDYNP